MYQFQGFKKQQIRDYIRPDTKSTSDKCAFIFLIIMNILIFIKVVQNFKTIKRVKKRQQEANMKTLKCVNSNIILNTLIRQVVFIWAFFMSQEAYQNYTMNLIYSILQDFNIAFLCVTFIIVSKKWFEIWYLARDDSRVKTYNIIMGVCTAFWVCILLTTAGQSFYYLSDSDNPNAGNKNLKYLSRLLQFLEILLSSLLFTISLSILYKNIVNIYEIEENIKITIKTGIFLVFISCCIRMVIEILLSMGWFYDSVYNKDHAFPIQAFINGFSYFFGEIVPSYFLAYMFGPQVKRRKLDELSAISLQLKIDDMKTKTSQQFQKISVEYQSVHESLQDSLIQQS